jgi:hypothetical protein
MCLSVIIVVVRVFGVSRGGMGSRILFVRSAIGLFLRVGYGWRFWVGLI